MPPRGLDHIVHAVRDLDAAADLYRRMGFMVGARNKHPWGTHNYIVQLPGFFIELLTVAEPDKLGNDPISNLFGRYNQDYLKRGEGLSLLILESKDAKADVEDFKRAGISAAEAVSFEREAKRPDGTAIKVGFSLAFAQDKTAPSIRFATCQQHHPENFWNPAFQTHANGVTAIGGVVIQSLQPPDHRDFVQHFTGASASQDGRGLLAQTPRGELAVMNPGAFSYAYPGHASGGVTTPRLTAIRFKVASIPALADLLKAAKIKSTVLDDMVVVGANDAMGAVLVFEQN